MTQNGRISYNDLDGGLGQGCGPNIVLYFIVAVVLMTLFGCKSVQYVPVETVIHDSIQVEKIKYATDTTKENTVVRDSSWMSIHIADSTELANVGIKLDGVTKAYVIEKNKVRELESKLSSAKEKVVVKDSIVYRDKEVQKPYPVPAQLTKWQQFKVDFGGYVLILTFLFFLYFVIRIVRRFMP